MDLTSAVNVADGRLKDFPHPVMRQQAGAPQPRVLTWVLWVCVTAWLPTVLTQALMLWPRFLAFTEEDRLIFNFGFFVFQLGMLCAIGWAVGRIYKTALWQPQPRWSVRSLGALVIIAPLLTYYISSRLSNSEGLFFFWKFSHLDEVRRVIVELQGIAWGRLGRGDSVIDVIRITTLSLVMAPVVEEMLFTGLLANRLTRRFGVTVALLVTPFAFVAGHMFVVSFGKDAILLYWAGFSYVAVRMYTGSLIASVICHAVVNAVIIAPKLVIAFLYFHSL